MPEVREDARETSALNSRLSYLRNRLITNAITDELRGTMAMRDSKAPGAVGKSAMRKALWHILPLILLSYLCAYMDRVNVSFAAIQMNIDLSFSATIYGLGGGLFFLGYALFEIPSNLLAVRYGSRRRLSRTTRRTGC